MNVTRRYGVVRLQRRPPFVSQIEPYSHIFRVVDIFGMSTSLYNPYKNRVTLKNVIRSISQLDHRKLTCGSIKLYICTQCACNMRFLCICKPFLIYTCHFPSLRADFCRGCNARFFVGKTEVTQKCCSPNGNYALP